MTPVRRPRSRSRLHVSVTDGRGRPVASRGLGSFLATVAPRGVAGSLTIALVSDTAMRRLNRQFLGHDYATDVLSFPVDAGPEGSPGPGGRGRTPQSSLGELAIALGVTARQSRAQGHPVGVELRILALHGLLHLLGYDHETDQGEMGRVEERLRRRAGLPVGLIRRAPGRSRRR